MKDFYNMNREHLEKELNSYDFSSEDFKDNDLRKLLEYIEEDLFS